MLLLFLLFLLWTFFGYAYVYGDLIADGEYRIQFLGGKPNIDNDETCYQYRFHKHKRFLNNNNNNNINTDNDNNNNNIISWSIQVCPIDDDIRLGNVSDFLTDVNIISSNNKNKKDYYYFDDTYFYFISNNSINQG